MSFLSREGLEVEALVTDRYLESLLESAEAARGAEAARRDVVELRSALTTSGRDVVRTFDPIAAPFDAGFDAGDASATPDPEVDWAARRLARGLVRVHPSFRFEEALAARLAETAAGLAQGASNVAAERPVVPARLPLERGALRPELLPGRSRWPRTGAVQPLSRPLLIGGALTSAAISLAGAAYVAWRRGRPPRSLMGRAARAAHQGRPVRARLD